MSYYLLVGIDVHDLDTYNQYFERAMPSLDKYGVEFIAYSDTPVALEEANPFERYAVVKFTDRATFEQWYSSTEYQDVIPLRHAAATTRMLVGVDGRE
jgi:uncharacterized protein (DUF1330 family)